MLNSINYKLTTYSNKNIIFCHKNCLSFYVIPIYIMAQKNFSIEKLQYVIIIVFEKMELLES